MISSFSIGSLSIPIELMADFMCKRKYFGIHSLTNHPAKSWSPFDRLYASVCLVCLLK